MANSKKAYRDYLVLMENTPENFEWKQREFELKKRKKFKATDKYICMVKSLDENNNEFFKRGFTFNHLSDLTTSLKNTIAYDYTGIDLIIRTSDKAFTFNEYLAIKKELKI